MTDSVLNRFTAVSAVALKSTVASVVIGLAATGTSFASGQVTSIQTSTQPATAFTYTADGVEYRWGMGLNQIMEGFATTDGHAYTYAMSANRVELMRDDIVGVTTGEPCGIFVERLSDGESQRTFAADYPSDGSGTGNCDLASMLASRVLNRGAVDLFSNKLPDAKNIERLDYVFDYGVLAPFSAQAMALAGHVASEKSSNNPVKIAAILELDVLGQPAAYGPLQLVRPNGCSDPALCYGITDIQHTYSFLQNDFNEPQSFPVETERSVESVGMAFISVNDLGLNAGQRYYGFSFFADDVDVAEGHNPIDPSTFPDDTSDDNIVLGDDADVYGGLSGYFIADSVTVSTGAVFNDTNGNGVPDDDEAGISDISITLYEDVNGNGILDADTDKSLGDSINTDINGNFLLPGLPDGNYLVIMDETDPELPPGLVSAPGSNPVALIVSGMDPEPAYFPFVNPNGNGGADGGADGTFDDGETDAGGGDGGTADGATGGGPDGTGSGTTDGISGGATTGGSDGGADAGTADAGGADAGTADAGGADAGATDAGGADAGTADAGGADAGATDAGGADAGTADAGGADAGATDAGGSTAGSTDGTEDDGPNNNKVTTAVDDDFVINQGASDTFDVLANDIDAAGGGLTLVSVSDSPNATITIVNGQIVYTPNFGFYGPDTFMYVVEDADGTRQTGTVNVDVTRFSDLNGNRVNDFAECGCSDLTLQTGVNGSGIGQLSLPGILALMMGVWIRRRSNPAVAQQRAGKLPTGAKQ